MSYANPSEIQRSTALARQEPTHISEQLLPSLHLRIAEAVRAGDVTDLDALMGEVEHLGDREFLDMLDAITEATADLRALCG